MEGVAKVGTRSDQGEATRRVQDWEARFSRASRRGRAVRTGDLKRARILAVAQRWADLDDAEGPSAFLEHAFVRAKPARIVELLALALDGVDRVTLRELEAMAAHDERAIDRLRAAKPKARCS